MAYPQNPVTVSKGDHIIKDVYLVDLPAWQAEGYEVYDPSASQVDEPEVIVPKRKSKSTPVETEQS